jgi:L-threonylcarbamoyladenylate synthase
MLKKYVRNIPPITHDLLERFKRPLTIIYPDAINLPKNLIPSTRTIAIRVVKHPFCVELIRQFNKPIVSTSANISGHASPSHFYEIDQEIKDGVGYIARYCRDNLSNTSPSTIIRLHTNGDFETIRD